MVRNFLYVAWMGYPITSVKIVEASMQELKGAIHGDFPAVWLALAVWS